ncbi:hypothetical protein ZWY2020_058144 [Hordeum vulgare]|nr:hypothetical protein ZWY2020_058144 [Hordeum vulgare]
MPSVPLRVWPADELPETSQIQELPTMAASSNSVTPTRSCSHSARRRLPNSGLHAQATMGARARSPAILADTGVAPPY